MIHYIKLLFFGFCLLGFTACSTLEKAALHGFQSDSYKMKKAGEKSRSVYVEVEEENIAVFAVNQGSVEALPELRLSLKQADSVDVEPLKFRKQSLDLDITSVVFKYRPSVFGLPAQMTTDFNLALYTGWRFDYYTIQGKKNARGKYSPKIQSRGFDFGLFAGPGTTLISPFTTRNQRSDEYTGMVLQGGFAAFFELNMASFGLAIGYDYFPGADRKIWIYQQKPWLGFVVGIALN